MSLDSLQDSPSEAQEHASSKPPKKRVKMKGHHWAGIVLFMAICGVLGYAFYPKLIGQEEDGRQGDVQRPSATAKIEAVSVLPMAFPIRIEATGHLAAHRQAEISAETSGLIVARNTEEGRFVAAGQVLFQLDDRELRLSLREAQTELLKARSAFATQTIGYEAQRIDTTILIQARIQLREAQQRYRSGQISQVEWHNAQRRFDATKLLTGAQKNTVQAVLSGVEQAEQRVERVQLNLSYAQIKAPFSGRVTHLSAEKGQRISQGQKLFLLQDDTQMKVTVDVLEADLVYLLEGTTTQIRIPSLGNALFEGRIFSINPAIDPEKGVGRVTVMLSNPDHRLLPGTFCYVSLETQRLQGAMVVPADAVLVRQGKDLVFVVEAGKAKWVYVKTGSRSGKHIEILEGLKAGDMVAISGHFALAHDAPVEITQVHKIDLNQ